MPLDPSGPSPCAELCRRMDDKARRTGRFRGPASFRMGDIRVFATGGLQTIAVARSAPLERASRHCGVSNHALRPVARLGCTMRTCTTNCRRSAHPWLVIESNVSTGTTRMWCLSCHANPCQAPDDKLRVTEIGLTPRAISTIT
jgi:hypothetical protein